MNEIVQKAVKKISFSKPPKVNKSDFHHWADYIELLCFSNIDGICSHTDFIDRISVRKDQEDTREYAKVRSDIIGSKEELNESQALYATDIFSILESRQNIFKKFYPFQVVEEGKTLKLNQTITLENKLYFLLLFSSKLGYFTSYTSQFTTCFEQISLESFKNMLPRNSSVHFLGSSNDEIQGIVGSGKAFDKISAVANLLKEKLVCTEEDFHVNNVGDGGIDLFGFTQIGDNSIAFPTYFAQCACTPEWVTKQHSTSEASLCKYFTLSTIPNNFIFIPYSFRRANGDWHDRMKINRTVVIDRSRLLYLFKGSMSKFSKFKSYSTVNQILNSKESLF